MPEFYHLSVILVTWFGAGRAPKMSGTVGSAAALPFAFIIQTTLGSMALLVASLIIFGIGWWASTVYLRTHPENLDPKEIVIDEVAGQWFILSVLFPSWQSYLVGFVLFRLFDALKPWPISWADRNIKGAFGVMFDDILAAFIPILVLIIITLEAQAFGVESSLKNIMLFLGGH